MNWLGSCGTGLRKSLKGTECRASSPTWVMVKACLRGFRNEIVQELTNGQSHNKDASTDE